MEPSEFSKPKLIFALLVGMLLPFLGAVFYFILLSGRGELARLIYGGVKIFTLLWPLFCVQVLFRERLNFLHRVETPSSQVIYLGLFSGVIIVFAMFCLLRTGVGQIVQSSAPSIIGKAKELGILEHYVMYSLALSFLHSIIEEYYWRWFVYGWMRRLLPWKVSSCIAALSFTLHHVVILSQFFPSSLVLLLSFCVFVGGILWSMMYEMQHTLVGAWVSHSIVDLGIMAVGWKLLFEAGV